MSNGIARSASGAVVVALLTAIWLGACGDDEGHMSAGTDDAGGSGRVATSGSAGGLGGAGADTEQSGTTPATDLDRVRIEQAVRRYVGAINVRDGAALCSLLAPGALAGFDLPVRRPSCAASLDASIGHRGGGGSPRWLATKLVDADSVVRIEGALGRLTGTVVHRFAGAREPSIEDDVIYLRRVGGGWQIAKPSSTFYRAIGARDVPIEALRPP